MREPASALELRNVDLAPSRSTWVPDGPMRDIVIATRGRYDMRFMVIVKASAASEAGELPSSELLVQMGAFNEAMVKAGVLLAAEGLQPSSAGIRLRFGDSGDVAVIDGPFAETKELIAGYWLIDVASRDEAIAWMRRAPFERTEIDIRRVFEAADFAPATTPEQIASEEQLRVELLAQARPV